MFRPVLLVCGDAERATVVNRVLDHGVRDIDSLTIVASDLHESLDVLTERRMSVAVIADSHQAVTIQRLHAAVPGLAIVSLVQDIADVGIVLEAGAQQHVLFEALSPNSIHVAMTRALALTTIDHHAPDNETIEALISLLAHHLREPIRSARLYNDRAAMTSRHQQWHDRIEQSLSHADQIAASLLSYLRVDAHEVGPVRTLDLASIQEELRHHYSDLGATPDTITWALSGTVRCQRESLIEILEIVIDNALLYSEPGPPSVDVASNEVKGHRLIRVTDNGPGISSIDRERAFRPLERLTHEGSGVGMGLAIARRLAGLADGDLFIQPGTSGGTTVVLRLRTS